MREIEREKVLERERRDKGGERESFRTKREGVAFPISGHHQTLGDYDIWHPCAR